MSKSWTYPLPCLKAIPPNRFKATNEATLDGTEESTPDQHLGQLTVDSNDRAVEYLHQVQPSGLDLKPIDMALACRQEKCTADDVFALRTDLMRQYEGAVGYISARP
jgi:hypothetical protein